MLFSRSVLLTLVLVCMSQGLNSNVFDEQVEALVEWQNVFRADLLWCGIMNAAPYPKALSGVYPNLDNCCRDHDNCGIQINRRECLYGICNQSLLFPILTCGCEIRFKQCLKAVATSSDRPHLSYPVTYAERRLADSILLGYFRFFPTVSSRQCIAKPPPSEDCKLNTSGMCRRRRFDRTSGRRPWQLFDLSEVIGES